MKIAIIHNSYRLPGGEDSVVENEAAALRNRGHEVVLYRVNNNEVGALSLITSAAMYGSNPMAAYKLGCFLQKASPDVVHFHNTFPMISGSAILKAKNLGLPVVVTIHNYRISCANGLFLRDETPCTLCLGRFAQMPAIRYKCYRDSRIASAAVAWSNLVMAKRKILNKACARIIVLTEFSRRIMVQSGIRESCLVVKPNVGPPTTNHTRTTTLEQAVVVGRLSAEKGAHDAVAAWAHCRTNLGLVLIGDGPLRETLTADTMDHPGIELRGHMDHESVIREIQKSRMLIIPSRCFEGFPMVLLEAWSFGVPVIAPRHGPFEELVDEGRTGFLFTPGDPRSLAAAVDRCARGDAFSIRSMITRHYRRHFTLDANMMALEKVYSEAREIVK